MSQCGKAEEEPDAMEEERGEESVGFLSGSEKKGEEGEGGDGEPEERRESPRWCRQSCRRRAVWGHLRDLARGHGLRERRVSEAAGGESEGRRGGGVREKGGRQIDLMMDFDDSNEFF